MAVNAGLSGKPESRAGRTYLTGVMVTPGRGYGLPGEGFFRISLTYPDDVLKEAMARIIEMKK